MISKPVQTSEKMLTLIFVETELETIPSSIQNHPQVIAYAEKRGKPATKLILDSTYHHNAMRKVPDWKRRGRPDIIHRNLLLALDSWANQQGLLDIYIHTRNDEIITVNPIVRLPKHYQRFLGLFEQLFEKGSISAEDTTLLSVKKQTLEALLRTLPTHSILLSEQGKPTSLIPFFTKNHSAPLVVGIGSFPHDDFTTASALFSEIISVSSIAFTASTITAKVLCSFEEANLQQQSKK